jgi:hypothetical protein
MKTKKTPSKKKCSKCGRETETHNLSSRDECPDCKRRRDDDDDSSRRMTNMAMGDMLNTGIPGGIDMDFTTPL